MLTVKMSYFTVNVSALTIKVSWLTVIVSYFTVKVSCSVSFFALNSTDLQPPQRIQVSTRKQRKRQKLSTIVDNSVDNYSHL